MRSINQTGKALGVQIHAFVFVMTMILLVAVNVLSGPPYWVLWLLPAWSVGLLSHWWFVLGPGVHKFSDGRDD